MTTVDVNMVDTKIILWINLNELISLNTKNNGINNMNLDELSISLKENFESFSM